jgi:hypothetical protein
LFQSRQLDLKAMPSPNSAELSDAPGGPCPEKLLLVAAIKVREQAGGKECAVKAKAGNGDDSPSDNDSSGCSSCGSSDSSNLQVIRQMAEQKDTLKAPHLNPSSIKARLRIPAYLLERPVVSLSLGVCKFTFPKKQLQRCTTMKDYNDLVV